MVNTNQYYLNLQIILALIPLLFGLPGCAQQQDLEGLVQGYGLRREVTQAAGFELMTLFNSSTRNSGVLHIYLGGDGTPWGPEGPSVDPTGKNLLAAALMSQDPSPAVYIGRPCYHQIYMPANCESALWTFGRYSETVVSAMAEALEKIVARQGVTEITLVGYSGGGVIALLLAQRLPMTSTVITIAANLDIKRWAEFHGFPALYNSLNPLDVVPVQPTYGQIHLIGQRDQVVPTETVSSYVELHTGARYLYYPGFDHRCCWVGHWSEILANVESGP